MAHSFDVCDVTDTRDSRSKNNYKMYCEIDIALLNLNFFLPWCFEWKKFIRVKSRKGKKTIFYLLKKFLGLEIHYLYYLPRQTPVSTNYLRRSLPVRVGNKAVKNLGIFYHRIILSILLNLYSLECFWANNRNNDFRVKENVF